MAKVHPIATQPACRYDGENKTLLDIKTPPLVCGLLCLIPFWKSKWDKKSKIIFRTHLKTAIRCCQQPYTQLVFKSPQDFGFFLERIAQLSFD